jgi:hypothetical protein
MDVEVCIIRHGVEVIRLWPYFYRSLFNLQCVIAVFWVNAYNLSLLIKNKSGFMSICQIQVSLGIPRGTDLPPGPMLTIPVVSYSVNEGKFQEISRRIDQLKTKLQDTSFQVTPDPFPKIRCLGSFEINPLRRLKAQVIDVVKSVVGLDIRLNNRSSFSISGLSPLEMREIFSREKLVSILVQPSVHLRVEQCLFPNPPPTVSSSRFRGKRARSAPKLSQEDAPSVAPRSQSSSPFILSRAGAIKSPDAQRIAIEALVQDQASEEQIALQSKSTVSPSIGDGSIRLQFYEAVLGPMQESFLPGVFMDDFEDILWVPLPK